MPSYTAPLPIADSNLIAELSMLTSAINTPLPADEAPSPCSEETDNGLFRTGPTKQGMKRSFTSPVMDSNKKVRHTKTEFFMTEPVTPTSGRRKGRMVSRIAVPAPMSPTNQSMCTEADEVRSMPPTPVPAELSFLPTPTKEQSKKRRMLRKATLKRNRCRKDDGTSCKSEVSKTENEVVQTSEPLDKKAARAIRNREAAMKSRVEAKQKMKKLQDENESLSGKVKSLSAENEALVSQLRSLLRHTLGVRVDEGQDVKEVFKAFAQMNRAM